MKEFNVPSEALTHYYEYIRTVCESPTLKNIHLFNQKTKSFLNSQVELREKRAAKIDLQAANNPILELLKRMNEVKIVSDCTPVVIHNLGILAQHGLLQIDQEFNANALLFSLTQRCVDLMPNRTSVINLIYGLGYLAKKGILKSQTSTASTFSSIELENIFKLINLFIDSVLEDETKENSKPNDHEISNFLLGLCYLFSYGIFNAQSPQLFNDNLITLICQFSSKPTSQNLSMFFYTIARLCYFIDSPLYSDQKFLLKLNDVISAIENSINLQSKLDNKEKIQLCEGLFYFLNNPTIKINESSKYFISKFHKKIFSEVKKLAAPYSTDTHSNIQKEISDFFQGTVVVNNEVFMRCGFHIDMLLTHKKSNTKVIVESDGKVHNEMKDKYRDSALKKLKLNVVHITNQEWNESKDKQSLLEEKLSEFIHEFTIEMKKDAQNPTNSSYTNMFATLAIDASDENHDIHEVMDESPVSQKPTKSKQNVKPKSSKKGKEEEDIDQLIAEFKERDRQQQEQKQEQEQQTTSTYCGLV